jgi:hypothetical protein
MRLLAFTFVLMRGVERRSATFYARSEPSARAMATAWAAARGWEVLASGTGPTP